MNLISYILLSVVIVAFVLVARYHFSGKNKKSCCNEYCDGCGGKCGRTVINEKR